MNKMDAYSKLFSIDDNDLDKKYYVRLLSTSEDVPQEVIDYIESFESKEVEESDQVDDEVTSSDDGQVATDEVTENPDEVQDQDEATEEVVGDNEDTSSPNNDSGESAEEVQIIDDQVIEIEDQPEPVDEEPELQIPVIVVEDQEEDVQVEIPEVTDDQVVIEVEEEVEEVDPTDVLRDFYGHLKKASVYRKIRNSDNPDNLCKSVSSFCTRYLIELHSSDFDSETVRSAVAGRINVGDVLRLLANYVELGDLNSLAKSVVIIRNFLESLDKEFNEVND